MSGRFLISAAAASQVPFEENSCIATPILPSRGPFGDATVTKKTKRIYIVFICLYKKEIVFLVGQARRLGPTKTPVGPVFSLVVTQRSCATGYVRFSTPFLSNTNQEC